MQTFPMKLKVLAALGVGIILGMATCWPVQRFFSAISQHESKWRKRIVEFNRATSDQWGAVAVACRTHWEAARKARAGKADEPPMPLLLAALEPASASTRDDCLMLGWTGGFDIGTVYLEYRVADGRGSLWWICSQNDPVERSVWTEPGSHPSPTRE